MKISCNVIKDILPLYVDEVVSDDTKEMVEEHLTFCEGCKKEVESLKKNVDLSVSKKAKNAENKTFEYLKKWFHNKKLKTAVISVFIVVAVIVGTYAALTVPELVIDSSRVSVVEANGHMYATASNGYDGSVGWNTFQTEIDGEQKNVTIFYLSDSPLSKIKSALSKDTEINLAYVCDADNVDQIYYGSWKHNYIGNPADLLKDMELIWEK